MTSSHKLTFFSSEEVSDSELDTVFGSNTAATKQKQGKWYTVTTTRHLYGTMDTGSVEFTISSTGPQAELQQQFLDPPPPPPSTPGIALP